MSSGGRILFLLLWGGLFFLYVPVAAQPFSSKYNMSARLLASVPHPMVNPAFKKSFNGVYDLNLSVNVSPVLGFTGGLVFKNALYNVPPNKIPNVKTQLHLNSAGIKLGYDHYMSEVVFVSLAMNGGFSWINYTSVYCPTSENAPYKFSSLYMEPELNINFLVEESFGIGLTAAFPILSETFDPYAICLNEVGASYLAGDVGGATGALNIGIGFYYGFFRKASAGPPTSSGDY